MIILGDGKFARYMSIDIEFCNFMCCIFHYDYYIFHFLKNDQEFIVLFCSFFLCWDLNFYSHCEHTYWFQFLIQQQQQKLCNIRFFFYFDSNFWQISLCLFVCVLVVCFSSTYDPCKSSREWTKKNRLTKIRSIQYTIV